MAKYEKKMMQFEAFQYNGELSVPACDKDFDEKIHAPQWAATALIKGVLFFETPVEGERKELYTRHPDGEVVHIPVGYYIIKWSDTELYPCEPNLFKASYSPIVSETKAKAFEIAKEYGYGPQSRQCIEEMAELIQAINKFWRKVLDSGEGKEPDGEKYITMSPAYDNLVEEIADVQIMLWQMEYLLNADTSIIIQQKIERQLERIEKRHAKSGVM